MSEYFRQVVIGDQISELPKSALPASAADTAGHYPFICSSEEVKTTTTWLQEKSAVLMGTGGVASVNYGEGRFAYSTDTWGFRSSSAELNTKFLFRKIQQYLPRIDYAGFEGSGLKHLRKEFVRKIRIDVPSPNVQLKIVEILDDCDLAIKITESLIAKYQQIKAGLMHDLFTRGVTTDGKLRPPREQAPELYHESPIGWIPKEWSLSRCADVCENICVGIVIRPAQYYAEAGVPTFRSANIRESGIDASDLVFIADHSNALLAKSQVRAGDVLTVRTGYPGTSAVVPPEFDGSNCVDILISRPSKNIDSHFLCSWINSPFGKDQVLKGQGGLAQQHFNVGEMRGLVVAIPSPTEQQRIVGKLQAISKRIHEEEALLEKKKKLKQGLMYDLLSGGVRVMV